MNQFDKQLKKIELLSLHPTYLPFVGDKYEEYRILHIGESHYIDQSYDNEKYNIEYMTRWWTDACQEVLDDSPGYADTRAVLARYMRGEKGAYTIFTNFIKSFSKIVLGNEIDNITLEGKQLYQYVAFMNFFQMPSLYAGKKFWDSLEKSAKKIKKPQLAYDMWETAVKKSVETVDGVIDILNPKAIVFTSISAGYAYREGGGKYKEDPRVLYTSHPGYPFTWWKELKNLDGRKGIDVFETGLKKIYNK